MEKKIYGIYSNQTRKAVQNYVKGLVERKQRCSIGGYIAPTEPNVSISLLLEDVKTGDVVIIGSFFDIDNQAQNVAVVIAQLLEKGVITINLEEQMQLGYKNLFLLGSRFELMRVSKRLTEGRRNAQERGQHIGRSKTPQQVIENAVNQYRWSDMHVSEICDKYRISRSTLYREIKRRGITKRHSL